MTYQQRNEIQTWQVNRDGDPHTRLLSTWIIERVFVFALILCTSISFPCSRFYFQSFSIHLKVLHLFFHSLYLVPSKIIINGLGIIFGQNGIGRVPLHVRKKVHYKWRTYNFMESLLQQPAALELTKKFPKFYEIRIAVIVCRKFYRWKLNKESPAWCHLLYYFII